MGGVGGREDSPPDFSEPETEFSVSESERCPSGQWEQAVNLSAQAYEGSNPSLSTCLQKAGAGVAQLARASAFQAEGRGFESRLPLKDLD